MAKPYKGMRLTLPPSPARRYGELTGPVSTAFGKVASDMPTVSSAPPSKFFANRLEYESPREP